MKNRTAKRLTLCFAFVLAFSLFRPSASVLAAPSGPTATFTVTTALDWADFIAPDTTSDGVCNDQVATIMVGMFFIPVFGCSLRSAIKTAFETPEADTVVFAPGLTGASISLKGAAINWAASGVTVDGQGQGITINGAAMNAGANMVEIGGSGNTLTSLSMTGARANALLVGDTAGVGEGNNNTVDRMAFYGNLNGIAVSVIGSGAGGGSGNSVLNSAFGAPVSGSVCDPARGNDVNIRVSAGAARTAIRFNAIYCGATAGVQVFDNATTMTTVQANSVGVGFLSDQNWGNGVGVHVQNARETSIISSRIGASIGVGVYVNGANTQRVHLSRNSIGDVERSAPIGLLGENGSDGVLFDGVTLAHATIEGNEIRGNGRDGVRISASAAITISRNTIGFPYTSTNAKNINGVHLLNGAQRVYVTGNTIGYNENIGVLINGENSDNNGVSANMIVGQGNTGMQIDGGADFNAIGARVYGLLGIFDVAGNTIISNTREGVYIAGATTNFNLVAANEIGQEGKYGYPNGMNGVVLDGTRDNQIGGAVTGLNLRNTIVNNGAHGILVNNSVNNTITGNEIGYSSAAASSNGGNGAAGNTLNGIHIQGASTGNLIGGTVFDAANYLDHNGGEGLTLSGTGVSGNTIAGNLIRENRGNGIGIYGAVNNTFAGTAGAGGYKLAVFGNDFSGIYVAASANGNSFSQAEIDQNQHYGLLIDNSTGALVSNVSLTFNGFDGIGERNGATNNTWYQLQTGSNGGLGIDKDASADNTDIVAANTVTITAYDVSTGQMSLAGLTPSTSYEVYLADADASGYGEGTQVSVAFSTGAAATTAIVNIPVADRSNNCFTVLKTDVPSSEFSQNYCRLTPQTISFAPAADRTLAQPLSFTQFATATSGLPVAFTGLSPAVCTVDAGGVVTIITTGSCMIRLDQPGNATFGPAMPVFVSFNVSKAPQTIAPVWPADIAFGSGPVTFTLSASSGLPVSLSSTTPAVCTVSGTTVTAVSVGICALVATQAGNTTYSAAPDLPISFSVTPGAQTITFPQPGPVNVTRGAQLSATASSGLTVTFSGGTPGVCAIGSDGLVTPLGVGECTVTANQPGNANYAAAPPVSRTFSVRQQVFLPFVRKG